MHEMLKKRLEQGCGVCLCASEICLAQQGALCRRGSRDSCCRRLQGLQEVIVNKCGLILSKLCLLHACLQRFAGAGWECSFLPCPGWRGGQAGKEIPSAQNAMEAGKTILGTTVAESRIEARRDLSSQSCCLDFNDGLVRQAKGKGKWSKDWCSFAERCCYQALISFLDACKLTSEVIRLL